MHPSLRIVLVVAFLVSAGCRNAGQPVASIPPAKAEPVASEANLLSITLTPEAQLRLGLETAAVVMRETSTVRMTIGEVVNAPLHASDVPTVSSSDFTALAARQAAADGELGRARAARTLADQAYQRAAALLLEEAGSARARDEAAAQQTAADAALTAALAQRDLLGPTPATMQARTQLWVRVPVFATDVQRVAADQAAAIGVPGTVSPSRKVFPVRAAPTANPAAGTTDFYYRVDNQNQAYRLGQRVAVVLPLNGLSQGLALPASALVTDIHGGEWVYRKQADGHYLRQRVEVARRDGADLILSRGLAAGDEVVTEGAAELFGYEFGTGR